MKNVAVLTEDGVLALFFRPLLPGDLTARESSPPGNLPSKAKRNADTPGSAPGGGGRGEGWGWAQLEFTDA